MVYLDNASTTPVAPKVIDKMVPFLTGEYGNPGSIHILGRNAKKAIEEAREEVASLIGAKSEQIIFTSGGTEGNNLAILGCRDYLEKNKKKHIITSMVEHDSVLRAVNALCHSNKKYIKSAFHASFIPPNGAGEIRLESIKEKVRKDTGLISLMYVNNEVGAKNDIERVGDFCRKNDILFHTDCVQAAGSETINVEELKCDFLTISSHKLHGPKGVGALYVRDKNLLTPLINGGVFQESGLRGGTENVPGIVGFGEACRLTKSNLPEMKLVTHLKNVFYGEVFDALKENGYPEILSFNGLPPSEHGKILNIILKGIDAETLVLALEAKEVFVSAGAACRSYESKPSHVLTAMGLTDEDAMSSIRVSLSEYNTIDGIREAAKAVAETAIDLLKARD